MNKGLEIPRVYNIGMENGKMINAALVLEGGALRSLYTAGVLDYFIEKNIEFSALIRYKNFKKIK